MHSRHALRRFSRRMKREPTAYETLFEQRLIDAGIPYKKQAILGFYIIDLVLPDRLLCIELAGSQHAGGTTRSGRVHSAVRTGRVTDTERGGGRLSCRESHSSNTASSQRILECPCTVESIPGRGSTSVPQTHGIVVRDDSVPQGLCFFGLVDWRRSSSGNGLRPEQSHRETDRLVCRFHLYHVCGVIFYRYLPSL